VAIKRTCFYFSASIFLPQATSHLADEISDWQKNDDRGVTLVRADFDSKAETESNRWHKPVLFSKVPLAR
jgi:hypothetical protein